jgi:hypothetical protein
MRVGNLSVIFYRRRKGNHIRVAWATHIKFLLTTSITKRKGAQWQRRSRRGLIRSTVGWRYESLIGHLEEVLQEANNFKKLNLEQPQLSSPR